MRGAVFTRTARTAGTSWDAADANVKTTASSQQEGTKARTAYGHATPVAIRKKVPGSTACLGALGELGSLNNILDGAFGVKRGFASSRYSSGWSWAGRAWRQHNC